MAQRAATVEEVRLRLGPAFTDPPITDAVVQMYLDDTACLISSAFADCQSQAHAYAAAHCVAMSPYSATVPGQLEWFAALAGEANGPASRSFSVPTLAEGDAPWAYSMWGRKFLEYRRARWGKGSALLARTSLTGSRPGCYGR
jgi:hypothetical protein